MGPTGIVHVHSDYSHDGRDSLEELQAFASARGITFVGLTEHAEDFDAARFDQYREHCGRASADGVRLIPGLEFRFEGFPGLHLLALGLRAWIEPRTPQNFRRVGWSEGNIAAISWGTVGAASAETWRSCFRSRMRSS